MPTEPLLRPAVRALIVDRADRVLLVRFTLPDKEFWAAPGGGIEPGESQLEALARELGEEVGEVAVDGATPIWTRTHRFAFDGWDGQHETFYLVRVGELEPRPALDADALRAEGVTGLAWWTCAELSADGVRFAPTRLPALIAELLTAGPPRSPFDVGV